VFLTGGIKPKAIPDGAGFLDLRSPKHAYSVDEIAETIVSKLNSFSSWMGRGVAIVRLAS
jgi:hypothetical protein